MSYSNSVILKEIDIRQIPTEIYRKAEAFPLYCNISLFFEFGLPELALCITVSPLYLIPSAQAWG